MDVLLHQMTPDLQATLGVCRILFGIMGIIYVAYLAYSYDLNWAFRRPFGLMFFLALLLVCLLSITFGFQTGPASFLGFLIYVYLFHYAVFYGLENITFQIMFLYFSMSGAGAFSHDLNDFWGRLPNSASFLPEICLAIAVGMTWFSASLNKCRDPLWRKGLGAYYFFLLPIWRRGATSILTARKLPSYVLNYATMFFQLLALPTFLFYREGGVFSAAGLLLFSISLSSWFIMTWLGEILSLSSAILLIFFLSMNSSGVYFLWRFEWTDAYSQQDFLPKLLHGLALLTLLAGFWTSCISIWIEKKLHIPALATWTRWMRYISRYTWGISVTKVFTSMHIQGPALFRVYLEFEDGSNREVFEMTDSQGFPTWKRNFKPTFVESIATKLTEICMELDEHGRVATAKRENFLLAFSRFLVRSESRRQKVRSIRFDSIQLIPPAQFDGCNEWFRKEAWIPSFQVHFMPAGEINISKLCGRILKGPTGRDLGRNSFSFSENIKKSIY